MLDFIPYITDNNVMAFLMLLLRFAGILAFFPFFDNQIIPVSIRAALAFILAVVFMPMVKEIVVYNSLVAFIIGGMFEVLLGLNFLEKKNQKCSIVTKEQLPLQVMLVHMETWQ